MIELEKKFLISKSEYDYILYRFGKDKPIETQVNYYFDTEDLSMNQEGITCRVRFKNGMYTGTMKKHTWNSDTSTETDIKVKNGIYDNGFIDMGLQLQGELVTERCILLKNSAYEVALDKNTYLGYTDYELEIEYAQKKEDDVADILKIFLDILKYPRYHLIGNESINSSCGALSKSQRFFELRNLNNTTKDM